MNDPIYRCHIWNYRAKWMRQNSVWSVCVPVLTQATQTFSICTRCHVYGPTLVLKFGKKKKSLMFLWLGVTFIQTAWERDTEPESWCLTLIAWELVSLMPTSQPAASVWRNTASPCCVHFTDRSEQTDYLILSVSQTRDLFDLSK